MSFETRNLKDQITHWALTGNNGYGGFSYAAPALIAARYEARSELFRNADGEEETSNAIIYLASDVGVGDYVAQGDLSAVSDPTTPVTAGATTPLRVKQFNKHTDLRGGFVQRKAFL